MPEREARPDSTRIGDVLPAAVGRGSAELQVMVVVFSRWEEVVGARVASHAQPLRVEGDTLVVAVDQGVWATQMRVLSAEIGGRLSDLTAGELRTLRIVAARG
jgi:predicted nucleic acid-binding Zn ribbon protein